MSYLINDKQTAVIAENIQKGIYPLSVSGLSDSARADFIASVCEKTSKKPFVIVDSALDARVLKEDLEFYMPSKNVMLFPAKDYLFHNIEAAGKNITTTRINTVMSIKNGISGGVVACVDAVMQYTLDKKIADKYNTTNSKICLRYCIERNTLPLPKSVTKSRIYDNIDIDFELTKEDMEYLNSLEILY